MNQQQNQNKAADGQSRAGEAGANLTDVLGDAELLAELEKRYAPSIIPPCRVCGKPLGIASCGGGEPTAWSCDDTRLANGNMDWDHYEWSRYVDRRQGGDSDVMELVRRYRAKLP